MSAKKHEQVGKSFNMKLQVNQMSKSLRFLLVVSASTIYATRDSANVLSPNTN